MGGRLGGKMGVTDDNEKMKDDRWMRRKDEREDEGRKA